MTCPHCGSDGKGEPIPAEHLEHKPNHDEQVEKYGRCYCKPYGDQTHFSRFLGYEIRGVYDGVLYWVCGDCGRAWPRFFDGELGGVALEYVDKHETFSLFAFYTEAVADMEDAS